MIPTLLGILTITFVIVQFVPGGPVEQMVSQLQGREAGAKGPATSGSGYRGRQGVDAVRVEEIKLYGFDKPAHERFFQMLGQFARFDLGKSFFPQQGRRQSHSRKASGLDQPWTVDFPLRLCDLAAAGNRQGGARRHAIRHGHDIHCAPRLCGPELRHGRCVARAVRGRFVRAMVSAARAHFGKLGGFEPPRKDRRLPLAHRLAGRLNGVGRLCRHHHPHKNSVLEEIRKQYVLTARAKGVAERDVLWRHVFRNAMIPIMTGFPAAFVGAFFSGSLLIETLFSLDGLGLLSYESVIRRDYPVVMGSLSCSRSSVSSLPCCAI